MNSNDEGTVQTTNRSLNGDHGGESRSGKKILGFDNIGRIGSSPIAGTMFL